MGETNDTNEDADANGLHDSGRERDPGYVAAVEAFDETDRIKTTDANGREVVVIQRDGEYHALLNHCPHQGGPIGEGRITGRFMLGEGCTSVADLTYDADQEIVSCPWHGWEFDLESGRHLTKPSYKIPTYDIEVRDGAVYLVD